MQKRRLCYSNESKCNLLLPLLHLPNGHPTIQRKNMSKEVMENINSKNNRLDPLFVDPDMLTLLWLPSVCMWMCKLVNSPH